MDFDVDPNLWVADVGDLSEEEVSIATQGANLGWPIFEGNVCLRTESECAALAAATFPIAAYSYKRDTSRAIIGGVASPQPGMAYIFGDYGSGRIWAIEPDAAAAAGWQRREIARASGNILSYGAGAADQVFVLLHNRPILRREW